MTTLAEVTANSIGKAASSVIRPIGLHRGTLVTRNLDVMRRFLEELLGMECVRTAPDRMLARHRRDRGAKNYWVLEICAVAEITHPQRLVNHWGFMVASNAEVDRAHRVATARQAEFGLKRVHPPKGNHGSYSFYFEDLDSNWWEIECRAPEISYAASVAAGDPLPEKPEADA
jgi:catechol 2,3-dioxygenase-like lactoylglutathione lyase family enzyme